MAPTFESETHSTYATTTPKSLAVNVLAGDTIVVKASTSDAACTVSTPTNDGAALTWTLAQSVITSSYATAYMWTATADSARTVTVSVARAGSAYYYGASAEVWRGATVGASAKSSGTTGYPSLSLTTTEANSAASVVVGDWNAISGSGAWSSTPGTPTARWDAYVASQGAAHAATYADVSAAGAKTLAMTAPSGQKWSIVGLELKISGTVVTATVGAATASGRPRGATSTRTQSFVVVNEPAPTRWPPLVTA